MEKATRFLRPDDVVGFAPDESTPEQLELERKIVALGARKRARNVTADGGLLMLPLGPPPYDDAALSGELVTVNHVMLDDGVWKHAYEALPGRPIIVYYGTVCTLVVDADPLDDGLADTEHSFTLANGMAAHNVMNSN